MVEVRTCVNISFPTGRNRFAEDEIKRMMLKNGKPDFGILLPMPPDVARDDDGDFHFDFLPSIGPAWRYENWGCDWNGENARFDDEASSFIFSIDTTYKPPLGWIKELCAKVSDRFPGVLITGIWVPNKFGDCTFGEFVCENGMFADTYEVEWDEPLMVKEVWELDDEDIIDFRGFVKDESVA